MMGEHAVAPLGSTTVRCSRHRMLCTLTAGNLTHVTGRERCDSLRFEVRSAFLGGTEDARRALGGAPQPKRTCPVCGEFEPHACAGPRPDPDPPRDDKAENVQLVPEQYLAYAMSLNTEAPAGTILRTTDTRRDHVKVGSGEWVCSQ